MTDLTDSKIDAVLERGRQANEIEPRAASARYDSRTARVVVELMNGCTFAFPSHLAQALRDATDSQLAEVEVLGVGYGLHWPSLDVDLSVPGIVAGRFGTPVAMSQQLEQPASPADAVQVNDLPEACLGFDWLADEPDIYTDADVQPSGKQRR